MESMIKIQNVSKIYKSRGVSYEALSHLQFEIEKGKFVAVMGPSGSGKTTLLNVLSTIDTPSSGKVRIDGQDMGALKEKQLAVFRGESIGFVFQEFNLLDNMSIRDNIALPLTLNNEKTAVIIEKIEELAKIFGITTQLDKYPYELSGGQRQRAAVCRALVIQPKILFADEPTGALDSKATTDLLQCFRKVKEIYHTTIMMVTHDAGAASYADQVIFLRDGQLSGRLDEIDNRKDFFNKILHMVAVLGGDTNADL